MNNLNNDVVLIGVDPGSSNIGVSVFFIDIQTLNIKESIAFTINVKKSKYYSKNTEITHGSRFAKYRVIENEFYNIIDYFRPSIVICESPFFNKFTPSAFSVLTEVIKIINDVVFSYNNNVGFFKVDPPTAKKSVGARGNAKKEEMFLSIDNIKDTIGLKGDIANLDEHSIDACAVAYYGYVNYIINM